MVKKSPLRCTRCNSTNAHIVHRNGRVGSDYATKPMVKCDDCLTLKPHKR